MARDTQISAYISDETKQRLDWFVRETGMTKARVIEDALTHHLDALEELPADAIIPTRIVLSHDDFLHFVDASESDEPPTDELRRLMSGE
jgi:predicted DNA-binding protein